MRRAPAPAAAKEHLTARWTRPPRPQWYARIHATSSGSSRLRSISAATAACSVRRWPAEHCSAASRTNTRSKVYRCSRAPGRACRWHGAGSPQRVERDVDVPNRRPGRPRLRATRSTIYGGGMEGKAGMWLEGSASILVMVAAPIVGGAPRGRSRSPPSAPRGTAVAPQLHHPVDRRPAIGSETPCRRPCRWPRSTVSGSSDKVVRPGASAPTGTLPLEELGGVCSARRTSSAAYTWEMKYSNQVEQRVVGPDTSLNTSTKDLRWQAPRRSRRVAYCRWDLDTLVGQG